MHMHYLALIDIRVCAAICP